ncbi:TlpA disulfide reductase family protein [Flaviramulus basaltis]|nr:TlpA disulfide reductase family protein [Flaviramulus basaltis]
MKQLIVIALVLFIVSCEQTEKPLEANKFRLNGTVINMDNGNLFLISYDDARNIKTDTLKIVDGAFSFESDITTVLLNGMIGKSTDIRNQEPRFQLFLEPTIMEVNLDANNITKGKLIGSKTQEDSDRLKVLQMEAAKKYQSILDDFQANIDKIRASKTPKEKDSLKYIDNDFRTQLEPYYTELGNISIQFINDNPSSYISLQNMRFQLQKMKYDEATAMFSKFPEELQYSDMGKEIKKSIEEMKLGIPGAMAGDFNTTDINGKPITLADFKGQYLLIDFWASWCVPCRKGNPHLLKLYAQYKSKGLEILGISDDDRDHDAWRKAVETDKIGVWRHVLRGLKIDVSGGGYKLLDDGISGGYNISTLPTKILVGPDGVIVGRFGGGGAADEDMDKMLAEIF